MLYCISGKADHNAKYLNHLQTLQILESLRHTVGQTRGDTLEKQESPDVSYRHYQRQNLHFVPFFIIQLGETVHLKLAHF